MQQSPYLQQMMQQNPWMIAALAMGLLFILYIACVRRANRLARRFARRYPGVSHLFVEASQDVFSQQLHSFREDLSTKRATEEKALKAYLQTREVRQDAERELSRDLHFAHRHRFSTA